MSDEDLFVTDQHAGSARYAILEDNGTSAWLYLTEPDSQKVAADAWVYNRITAPSLEEVKAYRGGPPPAAQSFASHDAQCLSPEDHEWSFLWSADGSAVCVCKDGQPQAFATLGSPGCSRELVKEGPWGTPWTEAAFRKWFS